jgi:hypothetical protein
MTSNTELLSNIVAKSGGYSRVNMFSAEFTPPQTLQLDSDRLRRVSLNCHAGSIPGLFFATRDSNQGGVINREIPHTPIFQNWQTSFYLSDDQMEKRFFTAWQNLVFDPQAETLEYYENYVGSASFQTLSKRPGDPTETYSFTEIYPKAVGEVRMDYQGMNQIAMLPVMFAYRVWSLSNRSGEKF